MIDMGSGRLPVMAHPPAPALIVSDQDKAALAAIVRAPTSEQRAGPWRSVSEPTKASSALLKA